MTTYTKTQKKWRKIYRKINYAQGSNQPKHIKTSKSLVEKYGSRVKGLKIFCELGVGSGRNIHYFHEKHPELTYIGNDINPNTYEDIKSIYPDVLDYASIEIIDTLKYLKKVSKIDITFTHGHLMHIPDDTINEVCDLIAQNTSRYILLYEAYLNEKGIGLIKKLKYSRYWFDRDYEGMFPGFALEEKDISLHPTKKGIRYGRYFFSKAKIKL